MKKLSITFLLLVAFVFILSGCRSKTAAISEEEKQLREVVLTDYKIDPPVIKISYKKPVRFIVKNLGHFTHELRILTEPPQFVEVAPNSKDYLDTAIDKPGDYEIVCEMHKVNGMKGSLLVEESNEAGVENPGESNQPGSEELQREKGGAAEPEPTAPAPENQNQEQEKQPSKEKKSGPIFD